MNKVKNFAAAILIVLGLMFASASVASAESVSQSSVTQQVSSAKYETGYWCTDGRGRWVFYSNNNWFTPSNVWWWRLANGYWSCYNGSR